MSARLRVDRAVTTHSTVTYGTDRQRSHDIAARAVWPRKHGSHRGIETAKGDDDRAVVLEEVDRVLRTAKLDNSDADRRSNYVAAHFSQKVFLTAETYSLRV